MTLFRKRPQLQAVRYVSPPSSEIIHAYPEDVIPASERAAKRRRIEGYARDVLKERPVFIASASLRGPFDKGWVNPWAKEQEEGKKTGIEHAAKKVDGMGQRATSPNILVPETEARPISRAGSDYCHDWLKKQHRAEQYSPDLDDEFDVQVREDEDEEHDAQDTPSRRFLGPRQKSVRLAVAPAWSRDLPDQQLQATNPNSLQVNVSSGVPARSISEQPPRNPYRGMLGTRGDTVDDTTLTKVSMISDDKPIPMTRRGYSRAKTVQVSAVDSPGFVFRRVGADGRRPWSRGKEEAKRSATTVTSITEPDGNHDMDAHVWVSVADVSTEVDRQNEMAPSDEHEDESEMQDEVSVTVRANKDGKWLCPMRDCPKRPRPYASRSGIKGHLKNKHGVSHVVWDVGGVVPASKTRDKVPVVPVVDALHDAMDMDIGNEETAQATEENTHHEQPAELALQDQNQASVSSATVTAALPLNAHPMDDEGTVGAVDEAVLQREDGINDKEEASASRPTGQDITDKIPSTELPSNKTSTSLPNRQDSRAYSAFTFNPEMSTQAALLRAHQAFQDETQPPINHEGDAPDDSVLGAQEGEPAERAAANEDVATPFRRPDIPSFFNRMPASAKGAVPMASTQDLVDAARDLNWSTVKKKTTRSQRKSDKQDKKRISFAGWPQAKPSQQGSLKAVEWSPSLSNAVETPLPIVNNAAGLRGKSYSQPEESTPLRSALAKPSASFSAVRRSTNIRASSPPPTNQHFAQIPGPSLPATGVRSSGPPSGPSAMPVPSYQEAQGQDMHAYDDDDGDEIEDQEIEEALDAAASFLSTWDVDKEVERNSVQTKTSHAAKAL